MDMQIVCGVVIQNHPVSHDAKHMPEPLRKISDNIGAKTIVLDKGYGSETVHVQIRKRGMRAIIPVRGMTDSVSRVKGRYRKKMCGKFDVKTYSQRNKTETIFSYEVTSMFDLVPQICPKLK